MRPGESGASSRWLELAAEDLAVARLALEQAPPLVRAALFHCQQAAEKALKSVLAGGGEVPPRTHDLTQLLERGLASRPDLETVREAAERLTDYAIEPRYPDVGMEYTAEEAQAALAAAEVIVSRVRGGAE